MIYLSAQFFTIIIIFYVYKGLDHDLTAFCLEFKNALNMQTIKVIKIRLCDINRSFQSTIHFINVDYKAFEMVTR